MKLKQKFKIAATYLYYSLLKNRYSKILFYHDVFSDISYTNMGTPIHMFKEHMKIIDNNGFELVKKLAKEKGMAKAKGGAMMKKKGMAKGGAMTLAKIRAAAKAKGYKLVKS